MGEIHEATCAAKIAQVQCLLTQNRSIANQIDEKGNAPLHYVSFGRRGAQVYVEIANTLLESGADPNIRDHSTHGRTPLHGAAHAANPDIVRALLLAGADPYRTDRNGRTPRQSVENLPGYYLEGQDGQSVITLLIDAEARQQKLSMPNNNADLKSNNSERLLAIAHSVAIHSDFSTSFSDEKNTPNVLYFVNSETHLRGRHKTTRAV